MRRWAPSLVALIAAGCATAGHGPDGPSGTGTTLGTGTPTTSVAPPCGPLGLSCNPIPISTFPTTDDRDTTEAPSNEADAYGCSPDTDESGPEYFYAITVPSRGIVSVTVDDVNGDDVDVDVHLLATVDPDTCLNRDNVATSWVVEAGTTFAVLDTWVDGSGNALAGPYSARFDFFPLDSGPCAMDPTDLRMFWSECGPGIDCDVMTWTDGADYPFVHLPSVGPVVKEAHLVTTDETFPGGWPVSFTDQIDRHYQLTEDVSGYVMDRTEPWAPAGEGGSEYGQGATGAPVPPEHETWYVNMYWRDRPAKGTKMILVNPYTGDAVVTAAGYETGPGANDAIGGATEEAHDVLGTVHRSDIVMGFAADTSLPYGPLVCD